MTETTLTTPPFRWLRDVIGIDHLADPPVIVRTRRVRGQLRHERLQTQAIEPGIPSIGCIANSESVVRRLEAPFPVTKKAYRVFPALLDLRLPFPETECERVFLDIRPVPGDSMQTLAVAARRTTIRKLLDTYETFGSEPLIIDHEALALWTQSMLEKKPEPHAEPEPLQLVIALRHTQHTLCIGRNGRLWSTGNLTGGHPVADIDRRLKALDIPAEQPLDVRWTGPDAGQPDAVHELQQAFNELRPQASHTLHDAPETMLARAVTTRALTAGPYRCNLRSGTLVHPGLDKRIRRQSMFSAAIAALAGICLLSIGIFWHARNRQQQADLRDEVVRHTETIIEQPTALRGDDAVAEARRHVGEIRRQTQPFADLLRPGTTAGLTNLLHLAQQHQVFIHQLEIENGRLIFLEGSAATWPQATALADDMEQRFGPLSPQRHWDIDTDEETLRFRIESAP